MTREQTLALLEIIRRALIMIIRHIEKLERELKGT
jgi:hypothetical protein